MRLVCPRCKAEYEVEDSAVPPTGRDVQCSACSHIWLQAPAGGWPEEEDTDTEEPEEEASTEVAAEAQAEDLPEAEPVTEEPREAVIPEIRQTSHFEEPEQPGPDAGAAPTGGPPADDTGEPEQADARPPRRNPAASPEVIAILREEAEREVRARRQQSAAGIEVQPDLGLAEPSPRPEPSAGDVQPRGRDRLPAIDEIGASNLGPAPRPPPRPAPKVSARATAAVPGGDARRPGRYRAGFLLSAVIATGAALVYVRAGDIASVLPEARPALESYVSGVDGLRLRIDDLARAAVAALSSLAERAGG